MSEELSTVIEISSDGHLELSTEQLQQAGFAAGDRLVISVVAPGQIHLHKLGSDNKMPSLEEIFQTIGDSLRESGYDTREKVIELVRDVRREIADER